MLIVRLATAEDSAFLEQMLAVAADWRAETPRPVAEVMSDPALAHYIADWPRQGDEGVVAEEIHPVGAAWWRFFSEDDRGYGFVDSATPEVSVGVVRKARGRGVGERLLRALIEQAKEQGLPALSLSVEPDNYATRLYARLGFQRIGSVGGSLTMLLGLRR